MAGSPTALADGLGIDVDDGTGIVKAVIGPDALGAVSAGERRCGSPCAAHSDSGTAPGPARPGIAVHAVLAGDLVVTAPTPTPTPHTPTPTPAPTPSPTPTPPAPTPRRPRPRAHTDPDAHAAPVDLDIATARDREPIGTVVIVRGTVVAEAGRTGIARVVDDR